MNCPICKKEMTHAFSNKVMEKYEAHYKFCPSCVFISIEEPTWLEEAYRKPITDADTGLLSRNLYFRDKVGVLIDRYFNASGDFLDYAGGYGVFTRLMRDAHFKFWHDDQYTPNLFAKDFESSCFEGELEGATCFECLEHFTNPLEDLEDVFRRSRNVFFSTELFSGGVPNLDWHYYAFEHGQHVSFYSRKTLERVAQHFNLNVVSTGYLHLFSEVKIDEPEFQRIARAASKRSNPFTSRNRFERVARRLGKQSS